MALIADPKETYAFNRAHQQLHSALSDLRILAGDEIGPSDATWQDIAGTCAVNLRALAAYLDNARGGGSFVQFPSPDDTDE